MSSLAAAPQPNAQRAAPGSGMDSGAHFPRLVNFSFSANGRLTALIIRLSNLKSAAAVARFVFFFF